ncbi:TPA: YkgJ family cysteine cluster protein [Candidatus Bathyarchaeota archaeon]|nr:YkgJ family cysteine cluster protein [Candidatus Bathyarchaeota archaeon]
MSALNVGEPCLKHGCAKCCFKTKMLLTLNDVKRIEKLGFKRVSFVTEGEGWLRLKNRGGKCFFLKGNKCSIYPWRPAGCRLYPLIYDEEKGPLLDPLCPHAREFKTSQSWVETLRSLIQKLEEEKRLRMEQGSP